MTKIFSNYPQTHDQFFNRCGPWPKLRSQSQRIWISECANARDAVLRTRKRCDQLLLWSQHSPWRGTLRLQHESETDRRGICRIHECRRCKEGSRETQVYNGHPIHRVIQMYESGDAYGSWIGQRCTWWRAWRYGTRSRWLEWTWHWWIGIYGRDGRTWSTGNGRPRRTGWIHTTTNIRSVCSPSIKCFGQQSDGVCWWMAWCRWLSWTFTTA